MPGLSTACVAFEFRTEGNKLALVLGRCIDIGDDGGFETGQFQGWLAWGGMCMFGLELEQSSSCAAAHDPSNSQTLVASTSWTWQQ